MRKPPLDLPEKGLFNQKINKQATVFNRNKNTMPKVTKKASTVRKSDQQGGKANVMQEKEALKQLRKKYEACIVELNQLKQELKKREDDGKIKI